MDKRSTILAAVFGSAVLYGVVSKTVYPAWIVPLLTYDERITDGQKELDKLNAIEERVEKGRYVYKALVGRIGSFDIAKVENAIRQQLSTLIERHNLKDQNVAPSRRTQDRKTGVESMVLTVQADGPIHGVAGLMRDVAELPQLLRFGNVSITPGKSTLSGGRITLHEQVSLRMPIEIAVLPRKQMVGSIDEATLPPAEPRIRHQRRDYAALWSGRPFSEYVKPQSLKVNAGADQTLQRPGRNLVLRGKVSGGIGEYTMQWSPSDGLDKPTELSTRVNTDKPGEYAYTLTVTDESGATASDSMELSIRELAKPTETAQTDKPAKRPPRDKRWADRRYMQVVMVLGRTHEDERTDEAMVYSRKTKDTSYYAAGDEFDGGKLLFVHQTGLLAHRGKEYYVYPIGDSIENDVRLADASFYPELQSAAERHKALVGSDAEDGKTDADEEEPSAKAAETPDQDAEAADGKAKIEATPVGAKENRATTSGTPADAQRTGKRRPAPAPGMSRPRKNRTRRMPGERPSRPKTTRPGGKRPD